MSQIERYDPIQEADMIVMKAFPDGEWVRFAETGRQRLPDRREADAIPTTHVYAPGTAQEIHEHMTLRIGRYDDGRIGEVFIDYTDPTMYRNERAKNLGHDIATLLSIALQYGVPLQVLRDAVGRGEVPWLGEIKEFPHTPIGTVLDALWAASRPDSQT